LLAEHQRFDIEVKNVFNSVPAYEQ